MKKLILISAIVALALFGCTPAKKILPRALPAPGVYDVTYTNVELKDAPQTIKDMANAYRNRDTATVAYTDQGLYLVVSKPASLLISDLRLKKATRTVTYEGDDRLKIDIETLWRGMGAGTQSPVMVAKLNLNDLPNFTSFEFIRRKAVPPVAPPVIPPAGKVSTYLSVYEPKQEATLTSPFTVKGTTLVRGGTVTIKLQDNLGRILAQTATTADQQGNFETRVSYTPPLSPMPGKLTLSTRGAKSLHLAYIRVTIK